MWILHDWLRKYHPQPRIIHGDQTLRSARILSGDAGIERQNVYLARAAEYISGEDQRTICVHGQDMMLLNTSEMETVLNDIFDAFDFYNSWSDGIAEEIRSGCDIQKIVDMSQDILHRPVVVYNSMNEVIGISSNYPKGSLDREWDYLLENRANSLGFLINIQDILKQQRSLYDLLRIQVPGTPYASVYKGLFHDRIWLGRIILLETGQPLSKGESQLFETFCTLAGHWATRSYQSDLLQSESRVFQDLIEGREVSPEETDHKLQMAGWQRDDLKQLIRIEVPQQQSEITQVLVSRLELLTNSSYVFSVQKVIYILLNMNQIHEKNIRNLLQKVLKEAGLYGVCSYPFTNVLKLADYNEQCIITSHHCPSDPGGLYNCPDYALDSIHSFMASKIPGVLKHPGLALLKQYDEDNHTDLYQTLYDYLRNNCNMAETARQLHLHRNSLLYRLNQIRELGGIRLDDAGTREHLLLSYYMV